jgi:hypothetical protein
MCGVFVTLPAQAQDDDDIWRSVDLDEVNYQKKRSYNVRLYGYYRFTDDGHGYYKDNMYKLYKMYEGLFQLDIRYSKDEDDGALVIVGRDLVHPEKEGRFMEFYELKPYTFLEKARRDTKHFNIDERGDTSLVYTKNGLAGTAVRDNVNKELRIHYNALAPDTAMSLNLLILKARISNVVADAVYSVDDDIDYVPQGNLKTATFEGDMDMNGGVGTASLHEIFHETTELYIDSVVYMTRDEYRADKKLSAKERRARSGYTEADIDRMKAKFGVAPLTDEQRRRIEEQQDWDEMLEQWKKNNASQPTLE